MGDDLPDKVLNRFDFLEVLLCEARVEILLQLDHELPLGTSGPLIPPDYWDSPHKLPLWRLETHPAA